MDALRRLSSQRLIRFMLPGIYLASLTFRAVLRHIRDSSWCFAVMESMTKLSARLLNKCLTLSDTPSYFTLVGSGIFLGQMNLSYRKG